METRILLGGGGSAQDEGAVMERLAAWVGGGPLLYLPIAAEEVGQGHWEWIWSALEPLGVTRIGMWGTLSAHLPAELDDFRGVLIGGGNTFHLLHQLRASGFDGALRGYAERGGVLYGGSAGAIVLGRDIGTAAYMDENVAGDADTSGLDLLHGDSVWCHYRPSDDPLICAYVERTGWATLALPENGGAWVRGAQDIAPLGAGEVVRFTKEGKRVL
jgi:dipeptidase E